FVVVDASGVNSTDNPSGDFTVYPNPAKTTINFSFTEPTMQVYYVTIVNSLGRTMCMLPRPQLANGIDISHYPAGVYFVQLTDEKTKVTITRQFVKE
ncbi:MAG: T9SS type A sorting domain-containing protein, partial [Bacteroidota bacterium]